MNRGKSTGVAEEEKTLLVVGETGTGKTTLIDGMFNFICGVSWEDKHRWKLTDQVSEEEAKGDDDTVSHTEWITVYTLPRMEEGGLPYCLNIIDTPGFGDTRGIPRDRKLVENLEHFFNNHEGRHGITFIDGVCFVAKAPDGRLTDAQQYIFNSVMSIFGKNIKDNIFAFATFADAKKPKVYQAFEKEKIPVKAFFKFNNSAIFACNGSASAWNDPDEDDDFEMEKKYWDRAMQSYAKFFCYLLQVSPKSTDQTATVLLERHNLQAILDDIKKKIKMCLNQMDVLMQENQALMQHRNDLEANKNFTITLEIPKEIEVMNPPGVKALHCKTCKKMCHYPCVSFEILKFFCPMFQGGKCVACKSECKRSVHCLENHHITTVMEKVTKTGDELKARYFREAEEKHNYQVIVMQNTAAEYKKVKDEIDEYITKGQECQNKINQLALREDPLRKGEFIQKLIEKEKSQRRDRYVERMKHLQDLKEDVEKLKTVVGPGKSPVESITNVVGLQYFRSQCHAHYSIPNQPTHRPTKNK